MSKPELCRLGVLAAGIVTTSIYVLLAKERASHRVCYAMLALTHLCQVLFEAAEHL